MLRVRKKYSPGHCTYDGNYEELRWDLSGCNLRCLFCWSPASRPNETGDQTCTIPPAEVVSATLNAFTDQSRGFVRFTGGEPTLQWSEIAEVISVLNNSSLETRPPILFQTNGIEIGRGNVSLDPLEANSDQKFLFELSFKGTNEDEFALLTGKSTDLYTYQLRAYRALEHFASMHRNVMVVAVLGVYHSSTARPSAYAFVDPYSDELLFEDVSNWDHQFAEIWRTAPLKWVEPLRMSPVGVWKNVVKRCGPDGAKVLKNFPAGASTNRRHLFPAKPKSGDYARQIVTKHYWR